MNDLQDLYAEVVMDHNRRPRNSKRIEEANREADGFNPLCGDQISLYLNVERGRFYKRYRIYRRGMRHIQGGGVHDE